MKFLVMVPVKVEYKIVEVDMVEASEKIAFARGTEVILAKKELKTFTIDLAGAVDGRKQIATDLLKIGGPVCVGQEKQKAKEYAESMKREGSF